MPENGLEDQLEGLIEGENALGLEGALAERQRLAPIPINEADGDALRQLGLLDERQIRAFLAYRAWAGPLLSYYELQAVPFFDTLTIRQLKPWIRLGESNDRLRATPDQILRNSRRQFSLRWGRYLEPSRGYQPGQNGEPPYLGSPDRLSLLFRWQYSDRLQAGFAADKDAGEPFRSGKATPGFDHYGWHLFLRRPLPMVKAVALGDFRISLGQGLLLHGGFGYGKGGIATAILRHGPTLKPHRSTAEQGYLRGVALNLDLGPRWEATAFASRLRRDGKLVQLDSSSLAYSSLPASGLHRTPNERADRRKARHRTFGLSLKRHHARGHWAFQVLFDRLDHPLLPRPRLDNRFHFRGQQLTNASFDFRYHQGPLVLFGEAALSGNGQVAVLQGLLFSLGRALDLAMLYRRYPPAYHHLQAAAFGATSGVRNETGFYLGMVLYPAKHITLHAYFDSWRHPWLRFRTSAPANGRDARLRLRFRQRHRLDAYLEVRTNVWEENRTESERPLVQVGIERRWQARLHLQPTLTKGLSLRLRLDAGIRSRGSHGPAKGICLLQDLLYRPVDSPWSFTARFALFDTDGYDLRFYHYENDLLGLFAIPAYFHRGSRWYVNLRFRPIPALTVEGRVAQTFLSGRETIGSGYDETLGPRRTELGAQLRYAF